MFKSHRSKYLTPAGTANTVTGIANTVTGIANTVTGTANTVTDSLAFSKLSVNADAGLKISSSCSATSTRVPSSDDGDREPPVRGSKAPKVPVLSANGKKLVEKLLNQCKVTSEFPLVELLTNTSVLYGSEAPHAANEELNAADKLQLAFEATGFSDDVFGFDCCCDVPEERVSNFRSRSCMKKMGGAAQPPDSAHPHPRPAQLRKRVCFRSGLDEGSTAPVSDVTELHLYELVRLKHRFTPNEGVCCAMDKGPLRSERHALMGMMPIML